VAVFGNIALGPKAVVHNDVVVIGGRLTRDPGAVVHGNVQEITIFGGSEHFEHLKTWLHRCLLRGRPLAFGADLWWAWAIAGTVFAFYVLLALLFPRAFEKCLETLEQRPGSSMLAVLLTVLITPVLIVVLVITGVGILLLPFMIAGLFFAGVFGKAVMHAWLGRRITKYFGSGALNHVAMATLVGGVMLLLLYTVPFLGLFLFKVLDIIGLGVVVYTLILTLRREKRAAVAPASTARAVPLTATMPGASEATSAPNMADATSLAPPLILAGAMLPRAGFWIRIAASLIDAILVGVLVGLTHAGSAYLLIFATYCVVLWALKGTTIGGIVCGLRVVRLDDRKVDWVVSVVRGLAGFLSLFVAGLGFIWVAFDDQKQSWHDKIAGTTVVLLPKGVSLI
ncbi:MAG: RDD family protein, partial [Opitutaceae bacterium]|nr:RDD family protein [Opitutaceae bacterium]